MRIGVMLPISASDGPGRLPTWPEMHAIAAHAKAIARTTIAYTPNLMTGGTAGDLRALELAMAFWA